MKFFSICTNDSIPDTLAVDRTYETVAGFSIDRPAAPAFSRAASAAASHGPGQYLRRDTMGGERFLYDAPFWLGRERIELAEAEVARHYCGRSVALGSRNFEPWPASSFVRDGTKRGETTPDCPVRSRSRATRPVRASMLRRSPPRRLTRGAGLVRPACRRLQERPASQATIDRPQLTPPRIARQLRDRQK